jgi:hypothetical protein
MLLQTNSYIVPKDRRSEHARLLRKFRQTLHRLGCDHFEVYEQVGSNWAGGEATGRFVQIMRFRDRKHQQQVQAAEKQDAAAQQFIGEFCALINFPYQQQQGLFAVGFYTSALAVRSGRKVMSISSTPPAANEAASPMGDSVDAAAVDTGAVATSTAETLASDEPAAPEPLPLDVPVPEPVPAEGASLLDFAALDPVALSHAPPATEIERDLPLVESELPPVPEEPPLAGFQEPGAETPTRESHQAPTLDTPEKMLALVPEASEDHAGPTAGDDQDAAFADMLAELTFDDPDAPADPSRDEADARPRAR